MLHLHNSRGRPTFQSCNHGILLELSRHALPGSAYIALIGGIFFSLLCLPTKAFVMARVYAKQVHSASSVVAGSVTFRMRVNGGPCSTCFAFTRGGNITMNKGSQAQHIARRTLDSQRMPHLSTHPRTTPTVPCHLKKTSCRQHYVCSSSAQGQSSKIIAPDNSSCLIRTELSLLETP